MNYAGIKYFDTANAPGVGVSLFVSGCPLHCKGCFNPEAQDYNFGEPYTNETTSSIVEFYKEHPQVKSFSLLGGEPFAQDVNGRSHIAHLVQRLRDETQCENYWVWSGQYFEDLTRRPEGKLLLMFDVLVDGPFELDKKDPSLAYMGSSNQRIFDLKHFFKTGEVKLWSES